MFELNEKQWKELEMIFPYVVKTFHRPPEWAVEEGMLTKLQYEKSLINFKVLEYEKEKMEYVGTVFSDDDTFIEYYLKDNLLYVFLYEEVLEFLEDDSNDLFEECDVVHTGEYVCKCICVQSDIKNKENEVN